MSASNFDDFFDTMMEGTMYDEAVGNGYDKGRVEEGDCNDNSTGPIDSHTEVRVEEANHSVQKQRRAEVDLMDKDYDMEDGDVDVQDILHELDQRNINRMKGSLWAVKRELASDELFSELASKDEAHVKYLEFNFARDIKDPIFKIGMVFANNHEFKEACKEYGFKSETFNANKSNSRAIT
ncbi:hypothetical protein GH714_030595 [Hevea brasiliensis]|uniref:Transposase MuDR plant domain-containing protein n=1 Tax=Hevea brasiliensis TaxID=3981 RepID=A0A6A6LVU7_HEVBR|nr:hypothetical protein GH714_030595 [Hevea brasiliensis]